MVGTFYIPTGNYTDTPAPDGLYSNVVNQIPISGLLQMQAAGDEIGSHSVTHNDFTKMTDSQINWEGNQSKITLESWGLNVTDFAYPYGTGDLSHADTIVSQYYRSSRNVFGSPVTVPVSIFELPAYEAEYGGGGSVTDYDNLLSYLRSVIDYAAENNVWILFYIHNVGLNLQNVITYGGIYVNDLQGLLDYIKADGLKVLTVNQALNLVNPLSPPPSVTINPTTAKIDRGQSQKFTSSITGGNPTYQYQWYLNNAAVPGATSSTYTFTPTSTGNYNIYLNVTDALNYQVQSNIATVNVYSQPSVTISPTSVSMTVGTQKTFTSTTTGGLTPYTYQWYYTNGTAITGGTTSTLTFNANRVGTYNIYLNATDSLNYRAKSNIATVNVYSQPSVTISPTSVSMTVGTQKTFTSTTTGGLTPYTYQWYLNGTAVSGATGSTWTFKPATAGHYKVYLNVTDALNVKVQSNIVTDITVNPAATVTISPSSTSMTVGGAQTFSSSVTGGTTPYTYQWYINGTAVSGATNTKYTFMPTTAGTYNIYLNVTDKSAVTVKSNVATAKVETPMTVNITPTQTEMYTGQSQTFSSTVSGGTAPYTYQWYLNDTAVPGATSSTYTFTPATEDHYKVYLNVTDAFNFKVQSNVNNVLVCSIYLLLTTNPTQGSYSSGQTVLFTINVFNQLDPSLETSLTLTITGPNNYGYFDVQPIDVKAGTVGQYSFNWIVPNPSGKYVVELELAPTLLTAYDTAWLTVN